MCLGDIVLTSSDIDVWILMVKFMYLDMFALMNMCFLLLANQVSSFSM